MRVRLLAAPLALLLLAGCASNPEVEVRQGVRSVLAAANDEDADAVRSAVDDLLSTLREQVGSGELTDAQAAPVRDAALAIRDSVVELDVEESPSPTPSPTPSPEESESPTPSPTPEPTEEPEATEEPEETEPPETEEPEEPQETEAPPPDDGGDGGGDGGDDDGDQATVVPQLPVISPSPTPTPTATPES